MREYKVTYETIPLGYVTIRDSNIVTAESKQEAVSIAVPSNCKLISVRLMPIKKVKKTFDITKHEVANHVTALESGELVTEGSGWIIDKNRAIAIAKALGVTGEDLN